MSEKAKAPNAFTKSATRSRRKRQVMSKNNAIVTKVHDHMTSLAPKAKEAKDEKDVKVKVAIKEDGLNPIGIANEMWHIFQSLRTTPWMEKPAQDKITDFNGRGYQDFTSKYAIIARYMLVNEEYSPRAFEKYLFKLRTTGFKDQDGWAERQADYVKYLFQEYNKHAPEWQAKEVWQKTKKDLIAEVQSFKKDFEDAKVKVVEHQKELDKEYRKDLREVYKSDAKGRAALLELFNKAKPAAISSR